MKENSYFTSTSSRLFNNKFNPIRNLRPDYLLRALEEFQAGRIAGAVKIFETILQRDDIICALMLKRKKSISRLESEIVVLEESEKAFQHKNILQHFYDNLAVKNVEDKNQRGQLRLLVNQMMDAVAFKYAVHKIEFQEHNGDINGVFEQYPLWMFENTTGKLRLVHNNNKAEFASDLDENSWMVSCSDGLMIPSSVAYIFKQLPLKDWLIYCERNGMPGIKAKTDAYPNSPQWDAACQAVADFGAEFHAVISEGTDIEAIDISSNAQLPYPSLIDRIDRMLCTLWRGSDLSTLSASGNVGASLQWYESTILEEADAALISDTLNINVDKQVIKLTTGDDAPLAKFRLKLPDYEIHSFELDIIERLTALGLSPDKTELAKRFAYPVEIKSNEIQ